MYTFLHLPKVPLFVTEILFFWVSDLTGWLLSRLFLVVIDGVWVVYGDSYMLPGSLVDLQRKRQGWKRLVKNKRLIMRTSPASELPGRHVHTWDSRLWLHSCARRKTPQENRQEVRSGHWKHKQMRASSPSSSFYPKPHRDLSKDKK